MKRLTLTLALLLCIFYCKAHVPNKITVGAIHNNAPYTYINEKGEPDGFCIELLKSILNDLNVESKVLFLSLSDSPKYLEKGDTDLAAFIGYSKERASKFFFSIPHSKTICDIITRDSIRYHRIEDIKNKKIFVKNGSISHLVLSGMGYTNLIPVSDMVSGLQVLSQGEGDCAISSTANSMNILTKLGLSNLIINYSDLPSIDLCFASTNQILIRRINESFSKLMKNGEYDKIHYK